MIEPATAVSGSQPFSIKMPAASAPMSGICRS
jgi:hypothetical protein